MLRRPGFTPNACWHSTYFPGWQLHGCHRRSAGRDVLVVDCYRELVSCYRFPGRVLSCCSTCPSDMDSDSETGSATAFSSVLQVFPPFLLRPFPVHGGSVPGIARITGSWPYGVPVAGWPGDTSLFSPSRERRRHGSCSPVPADSASSPGYSIFPLSKKTWKNGWSSKQLFVPMITVPPHGGAG